MVINYVCIVTMVTQTKSDHIGNWFEKPIYSLCPAVSTESIKVVNQFRGQIPGYQINAANKEGKTQTYKDHTQRNSREVNHWNAQKFEKRNWYRREGTHGLNAQVWEDNKAQLKPIGRGNHKEGRKTWQDIEIKTLLSNHLRTLVV